MKALLFITSMLFLSSTSDVVNSCKPYIPQKEGDKWEHSFYNAKGKLQSTSAGELVSITDSGESTAYRFNSVVSDDKGKEVFNQEFEALCKDGIFEIDMSSFVPPELIEAYKDMDMTIDNSKLTFPSFDTAPGTELEGSEMTIRVDMAGLGEMKMIFTTSNRKVVAKESVTVPAGTFECIVITQDFESSIMGIKKRSSSKEWFAQNIGMIRSENYNKKGKLEGYTELTKLAN